ncbi:cytochrome ubiquinol oxidase subunit I, partial [Francisella tularensis subsp. holarctica]|uniref:cytochrome ubiquinol oxidase subunit I n=1 Tax=Francisella tularensis TaxID=263 RepID=UPI002381A69E
KLASLINTHEHDGELIGLKSVPEKDRPVVAVVFYSYRIMVGIGTLMIQIGLVGTLLLARKKIESSKWFLKLCSLTNHLWFVAKITG